MAVFGCGIRGGGVRRTEKTRLCRNCVSEACLYLGPAFRIEDDEGVVLYAAPR
jgi:hypothetical protein